MKKSFLALLTFAFLTACSSGQVPPATFATPPSSKIVLNVATVDIVDHSTVQPSDSPYNKYRLEPAIALIVHQWLEDTVQAGGTSGQAVVTIKDASLSGESVAMSQDVMDKWFTRQQASKYTGHADISVEIQGQGGYALATAEATHSVTLPENPNDAERQSEYNTLLTGLMKSLAQNFDASAKEHVGNYILTPVAH